MKTYTIRPLEWTVKSDGRHVARFITWLYVVGEYEPGRFDTDWDDGSKRETIGVAYTIAAAKELAWQDWLRRITPALEEIK